MFSRMLAIIISSWLPVLAVTLPMSPAHQVNALVAGIAATLLAAFSLVEDRARYAAALVGAWVALSPFIIHATVLEKAVTVSWGVATFTWLIGPFSAPPAIYRVRPLVVTASPRDEHDADLPRAA
jgi:hypothetical protein